MLILFKTQQQKLKSQLRLACDKSNVIFVRSQLESQPSLVAFHWHQISPRRIQMLSVPHLSLMSRSLVLLGRAVCGVWGWGGGGSEGRVGMCGCGCGWEGVREK